VVADLGRDPVLYLGEHEALLASVDEGIRIAEEHGIAYTAAIGRVARGWAWTRSGARDDGIHEMRAGLLAFRATGAGIVVPFFQTLLAEALCGAGEFDEAGALLDAALEQIERWGERWQEAEVHRVQGLRWASGPNADPARAAACFTRAIEIASAQRAVAWEERARAALAGLAVAQP
jgi:predicted ATPase